MNVVFKIVKINGFMSLVKEEIDFQNLGVTVVRGVNNYDKLFKSNGSGKSAIFDSILWCLTGVTSRGASNVANRYLNSGVQVELSMLIDTDEFTIVRSDHYNGSKSKSLIVIKNGEDISGATYAKSKEILKAQLSFINYEILTSIIILSQGLPGRLSSLKPSDRKARLEYLSNTDGILEEIQGTITKAYSQITSDSIEINQEIAKITSSMNSNELTIRSCKDKIKEIEQIFLNSTVLSAEDTKNLEANIDSHQKSIQFMRDKYNSISKEQTELAQEKLLVNQEYNNLEHKVEELMTQYKSLYNQICPFCNSKLESSQELINSVLCQLQDAKMRFSGICQRKQELESKPSVDLTEYSQKIQQLDAELIKMMKTLADSNKATGSVEGFNSTIQECSDKIDQLQEELSNTTTQREYVEKNLEICKFFKSALSRNFRNFLLEGVIEYLNQRLEYYSSYLFSDKIVYLRSTKNSIDIKLGDASFEELSGGEGRRVDIALQLAQRDLAQSNSGFQCNLLILDEILDYLDGDGVKSTLNLLELESSNYVDSLLIVTHKDEIEVPNDTEILVVKDESQLSRIRR